MTVFDLTAWKQQLPSIPEHEFVPAMQAMFAEKDRRAAAPFVAEKTAELEAVVAEERAKVMETLAEVLPEPDPPSGEARPWKPWNPVDKGTWFLYGDLVTHEDRVWRSMVDPGRRRPNVWQPGALGVDERMWQLVDAPVDDEPDDPDDGAGDDTTDTGPRDDTDDPPVIDWSPGDAYDTGEHVVYQGTTYEVLRWHIAQKWWKPDSATSLYKSL